MKSAHAGEQGVEVPKLTSGKLALESAEYRHHTQALCRRELPRLDARGYSGTQSLSLGSVLLHSKVMRRRNV